MLRWLCNKWYRYKTKKLKMIPLFAMTFDFEKFKQYGKKDSCTWHVHPDFANDEFLREEMQKCVDYVRDNYDMETFTRI